MLAFRDTETDVLYIPQTLIKEWAANLIKIRIC
jgi:hypothetical protein